MRPTTAPLRSRTALVATVVPWAKRFTCFGRSFARSSAAVTPARGAGEESGGGGGTLAEGTPPPPLQEAAGVEVPADVHRDRDHARLPSSATIASQTRASQFMILSVVPKALDCFVRHPL